MASLPPTIAISASPAWIIIDPCAMVWPDEEHALLMPKAGPLTPNSIEMALTGALTMMRGTVSGWARGVFIPK